MSGTLLPAPAAALERATSLDVHCDRHGHADDPVDDDDPDFVRDDDGLYIRAATEQDAEDVRMVRHQTEEYARVRVAGCWYRLRDPDAGVRAYSMPNGTWKFWIGFYNHKTVCRYSGLRVAELVRSASEQEHLAYPTMLEDRVKRVLGGYPRQRRRRQGPLGPPGLRVQHQPRHHQRSTRGASCAVSPNERSSTTRRSTATATRAAASATDRPSVCGSGRTRSAPATGGPSCSSAAHAPGPDCPTNNQMLRCMQDPRAILPISRRSGVYLALRNADLEYERVHQLARVRNNDSADHHITRPRKVGTAWQQLHASASVLIDWILAAERNGWLDWTESRNNNEPFGPSNDDLRELERAFDLVRQRQGLHRSGEDYPGHDRERPLYIAPRDDEPAEPSDPHDDIDAVILATDETRERREHRARRRQEQAPFRPRGRQIT